MKKISREWWFLFAGLAALAAGLGLRYFVPSQGDTLHFAEGLCLGIALALLIGGLTKVRRDARGGSEQV
ncbi:MAG TPA: hypothetical protein VMD92_04255 [Acidobacteriaceae bacterium]|nr:hypothetical protein [Acidobacteriaceae bacterium]